MSTYEDRARGASREREHTYRSFVTALGSWFGAWSLFQVLYTWLIVHELDASSSRLGVAQLAILAPSIVGLFVGGMVADRIDRRWLLCTMHAAAAMLSFGLGLCVAQGWLTLPLMVVFGWLMGSLHGLAMPTRDALLSDVVDRDLMRAITGAALVQFGCQTIVGLLGGRIAREIGSALALLLQACLLMYGGWVALSLPPCRPRAAKQRRLRLADLFEGFGEVCRSHVLAPVGLMGVAVGLFFMSPYLVVFPMLVEETYRGDVFDLALLQSTFPMGTILGSWWLLRRRGTLQAKGWALVLTQGLASLCLFLIGTGIPFEAAFAAGVVWGLAGGVFLNVARSIFQQAASEENRARVLAIYTLSFMGAGAVGAPLVGQLAAQVGPLGACLLCGVGSLACLALLATLSRVLRIA